MKNVRFFIFITVLMGMWTSAGASIYHSATLHSLDDNALASVSGRDGSIQHVKDPLDLYGHKLIEVLNHFQEKEVRGDLNQLTSMFYVNQRGQTVLQINKEVVSIGVIEFRLHIDGLSDLGHQIADQLVLE